MFNLPIFIACVVLGLVGGFFIRPGAGGRHMTGREVLEALRGGFITGAILGAIVGILLSIFSIIALGMNGILSAVIMMVTGAFIGGLALAVIYLIWNVLVTALGDRAAGIIAGIAGGLIVGILVNIFLLPAGGSAALEYWKFGLDPVTSVIGTGLHQLSMYKYCFTADPHCPFYIDWTDANVQSRQEELSVSVNFKDNQIKQDKINLLAEISVKNPEKFELHLIPKCYLGTKLENSRQISIINQGTYFQGYEFIFPMSSETMSSTLKCTSSVEECQTRNVCLDQKIFLVLERPVRLQGTWPIYLGQRYTVTGQKQTRTELKFNVPWQMTLSSSNDLPFDQKKTYDFQLTIKQRDEETELKNIELIRLTFPEKVHASCGNFQAVGSTELELRNINETWLRENTQYDAEDKKYSIACEMYVVNAPIEAELALVEIESDYTVLSTFSKNIVKQPA